MRYMSQSWPETIPPGPLTWLQAWFTMQCNGDWEHQQGIQIGTLDNPGWTLRVDLAGTSMEDEPFERVDLNRAEHDWYECWVEDSMFHAVCGPLNLSEAIHTFRTWCDPSPRGE
jgi:hypothetical protein